MQVFSGVSKFLITENKICKLFQMECIKVVSKYMFEMPVKGIPKGSQVLCVDGYDCLAVYCRKDIAGNKRRLCVDLRVWFHLVRI